MDQREKEMAAQAAQAAEAHKDDEEESRELSLEEQAAVARALKPHARSLVDLQKLQLEPPDKGQTAAPKRQRKWQFGIRSRSATCDAMLVLYKAVQAQGGVWEIGPVGRGTPLSSPIK